MFCKDDIYFIYINKKEQELRKQFQEIQLKKLNVKYERVVPINGKSPHNSLYLTNLNIINTFNKENIKYLCIIEDDAIYNEIIINQILKELNNEDLCFLWCDYRGMGCCFNVYKTEILADLYKDLNLDSEYLKNFNKQKLWDYVIEDYFFKNNKYKSKKLNLVKSGYFHSQLIKDDKAFKLKLRNLKNVNEYIKLLFSNSYIEGNLELFSKKQQYLIDFINNNNCLNIIEIGFNTGYSAELILKQNENINLVSFDLGIHNYVKYGKYYLKNLYKNNHQLILGNSLNTVLNFQKDKDYDLIIVDGGHSFLVALSDIYNVYKLSSENTVIWVDDVNLNNKKNDWVYNPTNVVLELEKRNLIKDLVFKEDLNNGICYFKFNKIEMDKYLYNLFIKSINNGL